MKKIYLTLMTLPLLSLPLSAAATCCAASEQPAPSSTVIKRGLTRPEVESILHAHALALKPWSIPVSAVIESDPKAPQQATLAHAEHKGGYWMTFEWDDEKQAHILTEIDQTADLEALLSHRGSKAHQGDPDERFAPKRVRNINPDINERQEAIAEYKRKVEENQRDVAENLSEMREAPTLGRVAHELRYCANRARGLFGSYDDYYEEYARLEGEILDQLALVRYESAEEQEYRWKQAQQAHAALVARYPRAARDLPSLYTLAIDLHKQQSELPAAQRARNYAAAERQLDEYAAEDGRPRVHQLPAAVREFMRQYLIAILEIEARQFSAYDPSTMDWDALSYSVVQEELRQLSKLDTSALPEAYRDILLAHQIELDIWLSSAKDGKLPMDEKSIPTAHRRDSEMILEGIERAAAELDKGEPEQKNSSVADTAQVSVAAPLPESFIYLLTPASLRHAFCDYEHLHDYYFYLARRAEHESTGEQKGASRMPYVNTKLSEKLRELARPEVESICQEAIAEYKREIEENLRDLTEDLSEMREAPALGRVAHELRYYVGEARDHFGSDDDYYEEYARLEGEILDQLALVRYESAEVQEYRWKQAQQAHAALVARYPRAARDLPSLYTLMIDLHKQQFELPAAQRARNYAAAELQLDQDAAEDGRPRVHQLPVAVREFMRQYLIGILEIEARLFSSCDPSKMDWDALNYSKLKEELRMITSLDLSGLPEAYREILLTHQRELGQCLKSSKDGKLPDDLDLHLTAHRASLDMLVKGVQKVAAAIDRKEPKQKDTAKADAAIVKVAAPLPEGFIYLLSSSILLHAFLDYEHLQDYYFYLARRADEYPSELKGAARMSYVNTKLSEKLRELARL